MVNNPFDSDDVVAGNKPERESELSRRTVKGYDIKLNLNIVPYTNLIVDMNTIIDKDDIEYLKSCVSFAKDLANEYSDTAKSLPSVPQPAFSANSNPSIGFYAWSASAGTKTLSRAESDKVLEGVCPICNAALPKMGMSKKGNVGATCRSCKTWIGESKK